VRIREGGTRKRWAGLHGVVGVWSLLLNLLLGTTGFWMTRHVWSAEHLLAPESAAEAHAPTPAPAVSYNAAVAGLATELPDFRPFGISAISTAQDDYRIYGRLSTEPLVFGSYSSEITIDGSTGGIKTRSFISQKPLTDQLSVAAAPLHFGNFGGWPVKVLWCLGGLTPGVLAISGILIWRLRQRPAEPPSRRP
jgi:uncharacterized iron-regulated membrane protein